MTCLRHTQIRRMTVEHVSFRWTYIALHSVISFTREKTPNHLTCLTCDLSQAQTRSGDMMSDFGQYSDW